MAQIIIVNGTVQHELPAGTYNGTITSTGYATQTITDLIITAAQTGVDLTIGATGSLKITLTDSVSGEAIVGAKFKRSNADGSVTYGAESAATDENGEVIFANLPWADTGAPAVYFMQTATDDFHTLPTAPITTTLTEETGNVLAAENEHNGMRLFSLSDSGYDGMPIENAVIDVELEPVGP